MFIKFLAFLTLATIMNNEFTQAIDKAAREAVDYWHNYYRTELAAGRVKNYNGKLMPKAKDMKKMKFSMELEKSAQAWADKCTYSHSDPGGNYGESFFATTKYENDSYAIQRSITAWWAELPAKGAVLPEPGQDCVPFNGPQNSRGIGHWTQLAWWETNQVGCGIGRCNKYKTICCLSLQKTVINI
uniref:SCP domain-containing protein n=1 Tax=Meloidogyne hapla TaxID=6305 RepID=A0A1I8BHG6_MELHA